MHACLLPGMLIALVCAQEELSPLQGEPRIQHALQLGSLSVHWIAILCGTLLHSNCAQQRLIRPST